MHPPPKQFAPGFGPGEAYSNGPVWNWFGLSYAAYLVAPRVVLCAMPQEWQERFVALMEEAEEYVDFSKIDDNYAVNLRSEKGRFASDAFANYRHFPVWSIPFQPPYKSLIAAKRPQV